MKCSISLNSYTIFHQDLCSINMYDAGVALSGFACFITPDLARDLANDVMSLVCTMYDPILYNSYIHTYGITYGIAIPFAFLLVEL